jgi:hypothetical protein
MTKFDIEFSKTNTVKIIQYRKEGFGKYIVNFEPAHIVKPKPRSWDAYIAMFGYDRLDDIPGTYLQTDLFWSITSIVRKI